MWNIFRLSTLVPSGLSGLRIPPGPRLSGALRRGGFPGGRFDGNPRTPSTGVDPHVSQVCGIWSWTLNPCLVAPNCGTPQSKVAQGRARRLPGRVSATSSVVSPPSRNPAARRCPVRTSSPCIECESHGHQLSSCWTIDRCGSTDPSWPLVW